MFFISIIYRDWMEWAIPSSSFNNDRITPPLMSLAHLFLLRHCLDDDVIPITHHCCPDVPSSWILALSISCLSGHWQERASLLRSNSLALSSRCCLDDNIPLLIYLSLITSSLLFTLKVEFIIGLVSCVLFIHHIVLILFLYPVLQPLTLTPPPPPLLLIFILMIL